MSSVGGLEKKLFFFIIVLNLTLYKTVLKRFQQYKMWQLKSTFDRNMAPSLIHYFSVVN
jgi:hypothetical protein